MIGNYEKDVLRNKEFVKFLKGLDTLENCMKYPQICRSVITFHSKVFLYFKQKKVNERKVYLFYKNGHNVSIGGNMLFLKKFKRQFLLFLCDECNNHKLTIFRFICHKYGLKTVLHSETYRKKVISIGKSVTYQRENEIRNRSTAGGVSVVFCDNVNRNKRNQYNRGLKQEVFRFNGTAFSYLDIDVKKPANFDSKSFCIPSVNNWLSLFSKSLKTFSLDPKTIVKSLKRESVPIRNKKNFISLEKSKIVPLKICENNSGDYQGMISNLRYTGSLGVSLLKLDIDIFIKCVKLKVVSDVGKNSFPLLTAFHVSKLSFKHSFFLFSWFFADIHFQSTDSNFKTTPSLCTIEETFMSIFLERLEIVKVFSEIKDHFMRQELTELVTIVIPACMSVKLLSEENTISGLEKAYVLGLKLFLRARKRFYLGTSKQVIFDTKYISGILFFLGQLCFNFPLRNMISKYPHMLNEEMEEYLLNELNYRKSRGSINSMDQLPLYFNEFTLLNVNPLKEKNTYSNKNTCSVVNDIKGWVEKINEKKTIRFREVRTKKDSKYLKKDTRLKLPLSWKSLKPLKEQFEKGVLGAKKFLKPDANVGFNVRIYGL